MKSLTNRQIKTAWKDGGKTELRTKLVAKKIRKLIAGEILVEILFVPLHGSFWLAAHPKGLHPRKKEFMEKGSFVFGNGGVGRVIEVAKGVEGVGRGDYVSIFGHAPCKNYDCYACGVLHRYTECDHGKGKIIGHGKGAHDGTYAEYAILPHMSYEICLKKDEYPKKEMLPAFMYSFLLADVRNALTRNPDTLRNRRMLLFGAGQSGHIAAYIHLHSSPEAKLVVVDPSKDRLKSIRSLAPDAIETYQISERLAENLSLKQTAPRENTELQKTVLGITKVMRKHFKKKLCNIVFDASSGNAAPLWGNNKILSPSCHVIPFGFGSEYIMLNKSIVQLSGLTIIMSRGVGNIRNRREVIELIKAGGFEFVNKFLKGNARHLKNLDEAIAFIDEQFIPPKSLHEIPQAYMTPRTL